MRLFASVCVSVCSVRALNFEILDQETSFLVFRYIFGMSRSGSYIKVITNQVKVKVFLFAGHRSKNEIYTHLQVVCLPLRGNLIFILLLILCCSC